jgi:hypothetical protein
MTNSEWISVIALMVSSGGFALQARGWLASGPRLHLSVIADAVSFPAQVYPKPKLALTVINRGDEPTVLTHMVAFVYRSRWHKFRHKASLAGVVSSPSIPAELDVNKTWMGLMLYDKALSEERAKGHLYVGVISSHATGEFLVRVPPKKDESTLPTRKLESE